METPFRVGLLVTNTGFRRDAVFAATQEQNRSFLRLRDFNDLKRWLEGRLLKRKTGESYQSALNWLRRSD
jgi:hypothetical protein